MSGSDKEEWHNKGEQDASDGNYDPPGIFSEDHETRAYNDGYYHTKGQIDRENGEYESPYLAPYAPWVSDSDNKELDNQAYAAGQEGGPKPGISSDDDDGDYESSADSDGSSEDDK